MNKYITSIFCILTVFVCDASAHKVIVFAWVENGKIHVEAGFGSDRKAKKSQVAIQDSNGNVIASGKTGLDGTFSCPAPKKVGTDLTVFVDAGSGHRGKWMIKKEEFARVSPVLPENEEQADPQSLTAHEKMRELEQAPSWATVLYGVGLIFGLAFLARVIRKAQKGRAS